MAILNLFMSNKALSELPGAWSRSGWPDSHFLTAYRAFEPSLTPGDIKLIASFGSDTHGDGPYFCVADGHPRRYILLVIDIPEGSRTTDEKQDLMKRMLDCCNEYEGKHAPACDIEVRINEIKAEDRLVVKRMKWA